MSVLTPSFATARAVPDRSASQPTTASGRTQASFPKIPADRAKIPADRAKIPSDRAKIPADRAKIPAIMVLGV
jgi:hypothetical protein